MCEEAAERSESSERRELLIPRAGSKWMGRWSSLELEVKSELQRPWGNEDESELEVLL